ncbi:MAG: hypothetical protein R3Y23_04440 [Bacillota bacterium]
MIVLRIAIIMFAVMELSNVLIMYFKPDFKYGNSMNAFKEWADSKDDEARHLFAKYMVNWVANCKAIFIAILVVIAIVGTETMMLYAVIATVVSIFLYFVSLHPIICKLDKMGKINPKGYSKTLSYMIIGFITMFVAALIIYFIIR